VVFDLGCGVAVDLDQVIRQVMPEAAGLGDLGDVVGDQPCLMAVTESVEGQTRAHGCQTPSSIAVNGGSEDAAVEVAAADGAAGLGGEHERAKRAQVQTGDLPGWGISLIGGRRNTPTPSQVIPEGVGPVKRRF
jgi:hypothetical protein